MLEFFGKIYKSINDILADNLVVVIIMPAVFYYFKRKIEKIDNKTQSNIENVYKPLYNMFYTIENEYVYIQELNNDFADMDLHIWWDISNCEKKLFIDKNLQDLMDKFVDNYNKFIEKWENCVKSVTEQYNDIAKKVNGLEELCTEERKNIVINYEYEELQLRRFTFALLLKKYDVAFTYIVPDKEFHIRFEGLEDKEIDSHDLVMDNKNNIIDKIKNIKFDEAMLKSYNSLKNDIEQIIKYLSKEIKK